MFVTLHFPNGITNYDDRLNKNNPISLSLGKKIREQMIQFPCVPHIAMRVNISSFWRYYDLTNEERDLFKVHFENCRPLQILQIIVCRGHLEIWLNSK